MIPTGILVLYHCPSNTGYAIGRLEPVFYEMAKKLTGDINKIHFGYPTLDGGFPTYLDQGFKNIIQFDPSDSSKNNFDKISKYISNNKIKIAFGFDQPVFRPVYSVMRNAGIRLFVSYWGAPMSSLNHGIKLLLKKFQVMCCRYKPEHFIFESQAMANLAVNGRGIKSCAVSVIPTGVDTSKFKPSIADSTYAHDIFSIPTYRKIIFYSGHMEERKGVHVIIEAANELIRVRNRSDIHFVFLGNIDGQEKRFFPLYSGTETEMYITFGGYRNDVYKILSSCYIGVIASTGWDSFPMSSLEMMSSGLPLIASALQGNVEQVEDGITGYLVEPGNSHDLADKIEFLINNKELQKKIGTEARNKVIFKFSREKQIDNLVSTMNQLYNKYC